MLLVNLNLICEIIHAIYLAIDYEIMQIVYFFQIFRYSDMLSPLVALK